MSAEDKREARRQRILERSGDRLSRITNTGRGDGYVGLDTKPVPAPRTEPSGPSEESSVTPSLLQPTAKPDEALGSFTKPDGDPLAAMMAAMQGSSSQAGADPMAMFQQLLGQTAGAAGDPHAMPAVPEVSAATLRRAERLDRRMRLVQTTVILLFAFFVVFGSIFSPAPEGIAGRALDTPAVAAFAEHTYRKQWASLAQQYTPMSAWLSTDDPSVFPWGALRTPLDYLQPYIGKAAHPANLPSWPIFWVFFSLEAGLQGIRIALQQQLPAAPPTGVGSVLSMWAPGVVPYLAPLLSVVSLLSSLVDDLCILLFAIGLGVLFCHVQSS